MNVDYTDSQAFAAHPFLPFYLTGSKGIVEMWSSTNPYSRINEFRIPTKDSIIVLKYNLSGEKFGAVDAGGNFYLWKFNK
jgi:hypothetical protein